MPLIGALVVKEFQTWLRGRLTFAIFSLLVASVSVLVMLLGLLILAPDANAAPSLFSTTSTTSVNLMVANRSLFLFGASGLCVLLAAGVVAPAVAASAFAGERERGTLDLLLLQGPSTMLTVLGKIFAAVLFSLMVLLIATPLFAPAWSFGGVLPEHIMAFAIVLLTCTLLFSALGVFFGALLPRALPAALFAQGVALFLLFGTLGLHLALVSLASSDSLRPILWANPFVTLLSAGGPVTEAFARQAPQAYRNSLALPAVTWVPGLTLPAWAVGSLLWSLLAALLVAVTSVVIDPCHALKVRRR